jgi:hypothetical protein
VQVKGALKLGAGSVVLLQVHEADASREKKMKILSVIILEDFLSLTFRVICLCTFLQSSGLFQCCFQISGIKTFFLQFLLFFPGATRVCTWSRNCKSLSSSPSSSPSSSSPTRFRILVLIYVIFKIIPYFQKYSLFLTLYLIFKIILNFSKLYSILKIMLNFQKYSFLKILYLIFKTT